MLVDIDMHYVKEGKLMDAMLGLPVKESDIGHIDELKVDEGIYVGDLSNMNHLFKNFNINVYNIYEDKTVLNKSSEEKMRHLNNRNKCYGLSNDMPYFSEYGVCDSYEQILEKYPELKTNDCKYFIFMTPIHKSEQSERNGWRWHKHGEYIGKHEVQHEYLYYEKDIETVYCFEIYKLIE